METPDFMTPAVVAALGDGEPLTEDETRLLGILLDPANDPWHRPVEETLDDYTDFTGTDIDEDRAVADRLREHFARIYEWGVFVFEQVRTSDGYVEDYNVMLHIAGEPATYLSTGDEVRRLGSDEVGGVRSALRTAAILEGDWLRLRSTAQRLGLPVAEPAAPSVWPETDAEKIAFTDWQHEVSNGDTSVGFREWFTNREAEGDEAA